MASLALRRCQQCWRFKSLESFTSRGRAVRRCAPCRTRYSGWTQKGLAAKLGSAARHDPEPTGRVIWSDRSGNAKTGPIPVSISERGTCPPSCGLFDAGCYAAYGMLGSHWRAVGNRGLSWAEFLERVRELPEGQLWRHNEAGDLPGKGSSLDRESLGELVEANRGRRGFTFTHKTAEEHFDAYQWSNLEGFTVNLSADTLEQADALYQDGDPFLTKAGPVVVILPEDAPARGLRTPGGRRVVVCLAQTTGITCAECELCANAHRHSIVGFRAHGQYRHHVPELVQLRRKEARP